MHKNIKANVREETKHVQSIYNKISYIYFYLVNKQKKIQPYITAYPY